MAITDVFANIKDYFINWHTDNYNALHRSTICALQKETNERKAQNVGNPYDCDLGSNLEKHEGSSGEIEWYAKGRYGGVYNDIITGKPTDENKQNILNELNYNSNDNAWANICKLWNHVQRIKYGWDGIGNWADYSEGDEKLLRNSILGNIRQNQYNIGKNANSIQKNANSIQKQIDTELHLHLVGQKVDVGGYTIDFYRRGWFVNVSGGIGVDLNLDQYGYGTGFESAQYEKREILDGTGEGHHMSFLTPRSRTYLSSNMSFSGIKTIQIVPQFNNMQTFDMYITANSNYSTEDSFWFSGVYLAHRDMNEWNDNIGRDWTRHKVRSYYGNHNWGPDPNTIWF